MSALEFQPALFNTEAYAQLHLDRTGLPGLRVKFYRHGEEEAAGVFQAMQLSPGIFSSPGRGSYGGFDVATDLDEAALNSFLIEVESRLRAAGGRQLQMALAPFCYFPQQGPRILLALCRAGYRVMRQELNQAICVGNVSFAMQGDYANRKRLAKAARAGVTIRELRGTEQQAGYEAILENRQKKGRPLSMSWTDVREMLETFPDRVRVFGATMAGASMAAAPQENTILAAAICLAVTPRVFYVYAWGERAGVEAISPVSTLAEHLFAFAQQHGFSWLDLGTSSVDGVVNPGLHRFKRSLGATPSLKLWLEKSFA